MPQIVLHQWEISPYCNKVRRILAHKGLAYSARNYNGLQAAQASKLSPAGKLPVMDYDGERVQDSSAIAAFLEQKHPEKPVFPRDPVERAQCRIWEDWADESLYFYTVYFRWAKPETFRNTVALLCEGRPKWERWIFSLAAGPGMKRKISYQGLGRLPEARVEEQFFGHLDALETILAGRDWLVGDRMSAADISVAAQISEILRSGSMRDRVTQGRPRLADWLQRQS